MIVSHVRVQHFKKRFLRMILLLAAAPIAVWAQGRAPGYAVRSSVHYRQGGVGNAQGRSGSANPLFIEANKFNCRVESQVSTATARTWSRLQKQ